MLCLRASSIYEALLAARFEVNMLEVIQGSRLMYFFNLHVFNWTGYFEKWFVNYHEISISLIRISCG